jgi:hypothetical protein
MTREEFQAHPALALANYDAIHRAVNALNLLMNAILYRTAMYRMSLLKWRPCVRTEVFKGPASLDCSAFNAQRHSSLCNWVTLSRNTEVLTAVGNAVCITDFSSASLKIVL